MNDVKLSGRLTADPKGSTTANGKTVANFSLAIDRYYKDANGETQKDADFFQIACYNSLAKFVLDYIHKGDKIFVSGFMKQSKWTDTNGNKRERVGVIAQSIETMSSKRATTEAPSETTTEVTPVERKAEDTKIVEATPETATEPAKVTAEEIVAKAEANGIPAEIQSEFDVFGSEIDDTVFGF